MSSQLPNCVVWVLFIFQRYWYQKLKNYHFNLYKIIITYFILISSKPEYNIVVKERCWEYVSRLFSYIEKVILNFNFPVFKQNTLLKTHIRYTSNVFFLIQLSLLWSVVVYWGFIAKRKASHAEIAVDFDLVSSSNQVKKEDSRCFSVWW